MNDKLNFIDERQKRRYEKVLQKTEEEYLQEIAILKNREDFLEEYVDTVFNANVIIPHRDSLMVRISFSDGWAGNGVLLHIKRNQFNTNVFEFSDTQVVGEFGNVIEPKLTTKIYNQKLIFIK